MKKIVLLVLVFILPISLVSCSNNVSHPMNHNHKMSNMMVNSEKDFLNQMIPHHEEAVKSSNELAKLIAFNSPSQHQIELVRLLSSITSAQSKEITDMKSWYKKYYKTEYKDTGTYNNMMSDFSKMKIDLAVKTYLSDMIIHHQHAIGMARMTLRINGLHKEVKNLCKAIISTQQAEIKQMKSMLKDF